MGNLKSDEKFDAKQAYNTNLTPSARLHYLENNRHDHRGAGKMLSNASPAKNQNKGYADSRELTDMPLTKDMTGGRGTSWMSKHATQRFSSPVKAHLSDAQEKKLSPELKAAMHYNKDERDESGSMAKMVSPLNQYDDVVLGGNKGDKSKTKPGEKDYEDKK